MPGIFGVLGQQCEAQQLFKSAIDRVWSGVSWIQSDRALVGGHSFEELGNLARLSADRWIATDGDPASMRSLSEIQSGSKLSDAKPLFDTDLDLPESLQGSLSNSAIVDLESGACRISTNCVASIPLYYYCPPGKDFFVFSSLLRPIQKAFGSHVDKHSLYTFVQLGHTIGHHTTFAKIYRVTAGQSISYDPIRKQIRKQEASTPWHESTLTAQTTRQAAERVQTCLDQAVDDSLVRDEVNAVMVSAGWDSRNLLPSIVKSRIPSRVIGYIHGDLQSREVSIARSLCESIRMDLTEASITGQSFELDFLDSVFDKSESVMFPYWNRASRVLSEHKVKCTVSGISAELVGGHGAFAKLIRRRSAKAKEYMRCYFTSGDSADPVPLLRQELFKGAASRVFTEEFLDEIQRSRDVVVGRFENRIEELRSRGIERNDRLNEVWGMEERNRAFTPQILALRNEMNVGIPYACYQLLNTVASIPMQYRVHYQINVQLLRENFPSLLSPPTAAQLLSGRWPVLAQMASRHVKEWSEKRRWKRYFQSQGKSDAPPAGWNNFEFLRGSKLDMLLAIVDDLEASVWDKQKLETYLRDSFGDMKNTRKGFGVARELMKVYSIDKLIR